MAEKSKSPSGKRRRKKHDQIDVAAILKKPVKVGKGSDARNMAQFEIRLRAQKKKALKEKSFPAIMNLLRVAQTYELIKPAPEPVRRGGVLVVPNRLTKESWEALFEKPKPDDGSDKSSKS